MSHYLPVYKPGDSITLTASAAVTGGQYVTITGDNEAAPAGAASPAWVGVAGFDAAEGDLFTVFTGGVQEATASGSISAGDLLVTAANGQVTSADAGDEAFSAPTVVGVAMTNAQSGAKVRVLSAR